ncbi:MAG: hypothetical protein K6T54_12295, partial [Ignavibacterium sp.]|nr:hypothetical protein [Ignavibacterium sp.]
VLHMLRNEIGDSNFFGALKNYFEKFKYGNASTEDFKEVCESVSSMNLDKFFDDWIYNDKGIIKCEYNFINGNEKNLITIKQVGELFDDFHFNLEVEIVYADGSKELKTFRIKKNLLSIELNPSKKIKEVFPDPEGKLLALFFKEDEQQ